jgi:hypothetical protein
LELVRANFCKTGVGHALSIALASFWMRV